MHRSQAVRRVLKHQRCLELVILKGHGVQGDFEVLATGDNVYLWFARDDFYRVKMILFPEDIVMTSQGFNRCTHVQLAQRLVIMPIRTDFNKFGHGLILRGQVIQAFCMIIFKTIERHFTPLGPGSLFGDSLFHRDNRGHGRAVCVAKVRGGLAAPSGFEFPPQTEPSQLRRVVLGFLAR